jgi:arylsulfatase A-like enzyme
VEVVRVVVTGRLDPGLVAVVALALTTLVVTGGVGLVVSGLLGLLPPVRRGGRSLWFLLGAAAAGLSCLAAYWFGDPPPFAAVSPLHGNPWVFAVTAVGLLGLIAALWPRLSRVQQGLVLLMLGAVGVAMAFVGRPPRLVPTTAEEGPNVLLVTIDSARADRFRGARADTAATDRVAEQGAWFERAYAQIPYTGPSHVTLLTGSAPWDHGVLLDGVALPSDRPTLAEVLVGHGWDTGAFVSDWALHGRLGFRRGFRVYDDDFAWAKGTRDVLPGRLLGLARGGRAVEPPERRAGATVDRALHWVQRRHLPWFAWVNLADPRAPWDPPQPYDSRYYDGDDPRDTRVVGLNAIATPEWLAPHIEGITDPEYLVARYDGEVAYADAQVARLLDALDTGGATANTLVVVTAPHGIALGEGGRWFVHGTLEEADLHVPLAIRYPVAVEPGRVVDEPVELTDLAPTVLAWLGVEAPSSWTGVPLTGAVDGRGAARSLARSMAFDSEAITREDEPAWRVAAVRNRQDLYLHREAPGAEDWFSASEVGEGTGEAERALLGDLMAERARDLMARRERDAFRLPVLPEVDRKLLESRGWKVRPESASPP